MSMRIMIMLVEMDCIYIELFKSYQPFKVQHAALNNIFIHTHIYITIYSTFVYLSSMLNLESHLT